MGPLKYICQIPLSYQDNNSVKSLMLVFSRMELVDVNLVAEIERKSFPTPYTQQIYLSMIDERKKYSWWVVHPEPRSSDRDFPQVFSYIGYMKIGDRAHLAKIATHPGWRRHGLGEWTLINGMLAAQAEGASYVTLEVRASNFAAQQMYFKWNYIELQRIGGYYTDTGEDGLILGFPGLNSKQVLSWLEQELGKISISCP